MPNSDRTLLERLNPRFRFTRSGKPRHVDSIGPRLLADMEATADEYLVELVGIEQLQGLYLPPALRADPSIPHAYCTKRFTPDLQPIHYVRREKGKQPQICMWDWSTRHNHDRPRSSPGGYPALLSAAPPVTAGHLWAKLLLGNFALAVRYDASEELGCLLLDLDFRLRREDAELSLLDLLAEERALLLGELAAAVRRVEQELGLELGPHWMASGGKGCWLQIFLAQPAPRAPLEALGRLLKTEMPAQIGDYEVRVDETNLGGQACRMPLSRHVQTGKQAVFLNPDDWGPCEDQLAYILTIEKKVNATDPKAAVKGGGPRELASMERAARQDLALKWQGGSHPAAPPSNTVDALAYPGPRWTVGEVVARVKGGEGHVSDDWRTYLPPVIPEGGTHELLIGQGMQARCLAAMIQEGELDPEQPFATFPYADFRTVCEPRLQGTDSRTPQRMADIQTSVRHDLLQMTEGWRPHLPASISPEESEWAEVLAERVINSKPANVSRRGEVPEMAQVLRFLAIVGQGGVATFTNQRAVRHLGWAPWDLAAEHPSVEAARKRFERMLAWIQEGTEKQSKLNMGPLICKVRQGFSFRDSGRAAASTYELLWENWGGPFLLRVQSRTSGDN